jgi:hypothetical protein
MRVKAPAVYNDSSSKKTLGIIREGFIVQIYNSNRKLLSLSLTI